MGKVVNAQASAYSKLDQLSTIHKTILFEISRELLDIKKILGEKNGFYATDTNKKINSLIDTLEKELIPQLKTTFESSEKKLSKMEEVLKESDKI